MAIFNDGQCYWSTSKRILLYSIYIHHKTTIFHHFKGKREENFNQSDQHQHFFLSALCPQHLTNFLIICCFHHLIWYLKLSLFGAYETLSVDDEAWYWILCKCLILLGWFFKQYNYTLNTLWNFIQCGNVHCNHSYPVISSLMTEFMKSSSKLSQRRTDWFLFCYSWRD